MPAKEAHLYQKLTNKNVLCRNCAHYCKIVPETRGLCGVRENIKGKLYTLNYNLVAALHVDPIEKKPFFHFLPGTQTLSVALAGCNFKCDNCQNWDISQSPSLDKKIEGEKILPQKIVKTALEKNLPSISYTYTEPTIFSEYALETMKLAKENNIKNCWVSNGYLSPELLNSISPYLDAINIDLKSFSDDFYLKNCGARLQPVLNTLKAMKQKGVWVEITTLVIPGLNDTRAVFENIAKFIKNNLGTGIPWHLSQFSGAPSWKLKNIIETPVETLKLAYQIGKKHCLKYVYTGNVPGLPTEDTFCPNCGQLAVDRTPYGIKRYDKKGKCEKCGADLKLILE